MSLEIETAGSKDFGPCDCCGDMSRSVWGYIYRDGNAEAAYFVQWTLGQVERHGANVDIIVGAWGDGATAEERSAVALEFRRGRGFRVVDAKDRSAGGSRLAKRILARSEVVGTPLADSVFELVDAVWLQDQRISEVSGVTG